MRAPHWTAAGDTEPLTVKGLNVLLGLIVAMATAAVLFLAARTSPTTVAPRAAAEDDLRPA